MAIMGRPVLFAGETKRMQTVEAIVTGYADMIRAKDRAKWTQENRALAKLFFELGSQDTTDG
jgi:hypothetical protein